MFEHRHSFLSRIKSKQPSKSFCAVWKMQKKQGKNIYLNAKESWFPNVPSWANYDQENLNVNWQQKG